MDFFYDGQIRRYITQFIRALSGFSYQDGEGNLKQVPVRFGTLNKQAASILRQNSENFLMQAPFISVYIDNLELSRERMQDPTYVSKVHVTEREFGYVDENPNSPTFGQYIEDYAAKRGADATVERLMPNPYQLSLKADIWTTNIDQKLQILEQIVVLFNPAIELQTTSSYLDWTSLTTLELMDITYTNQTIPTGDQDLEIASLRFMAPIWLSPPAKVKRHGVITSIVARVFDEEGNLTTDLLAGSLISRQVITLYGYGVMITNNASSGSPQYIAKLLGHVESVKNTFDTPISKLGQNINWREILERYPGKFVAGYSKLQLTKADGKLATATLSLDSLDETIMHLTFDNQSLPTNTLISGAGAITAARGTVDAIIDPTRPLPATKTLDMRFLILEEINPDSIVNFSDSVPYFRNSNGTTFLRAKANDIIQWDGATWHVIFNSSAQTGPTFITNAYTGIQYKWDGSEWTKSMEGTFDNGSWQIIL